MDRFVRIVAAFVLFLSLIEPMRGQTSTGSISGTITDQNQALITGAVVTVRNIATGLRRSGTRNSDGTYNFLDLPIGTYEITIEAPRFSKYIQTGIQLLVNQNAVVNVIMWAGSVNAVVNVNSDASVLNTATPEVATRFDSHRLSELPIAPDRNLYNVLLSVPGVSQLSGGQITFAMGISYSANGGRLRSNNFMLDGQDMNEPAISGTEMPLNNPDAIQEVRIVTNQFLPEYGHNSGSVVNIIGKSGTNNIHGSAFWFQNDQYLNACSNLDKSAGFCDASAGDRSKQRAPRRLENQFGFTMGGPITLPALGDGGPSMYDGRDKTFFFTDYQRWSDRRLRSGFKLSGAPTAAGRAALQENAGGRMQVQALLRLVPAGTPNGNFRDVNIGNGQSFRVDLGDVTGSSEFRFDNDQGSIRVDHVFNKNNLIYARYRYSYESTTGTGQVTPPGLSQKDHRNSNAATVVWTSQLSERLSNEARIAFKRRNFARDVEDPLVSGFPSIQIQDIGLTGAIDSESRTGFGPATNLPVVRTDDTCQATDGISFLEGKHFYKFGVELRRTDDKVFFPAGARGSLSYPTLNDFVNDRPSSATKSFPVPGGDQVAYYKWHEFYWYAQDQWKIRPNLTLTYGVRYEYPGDSFRYLRDLNKHILAANNNDPAFRFEPEPKADTNNWMPRLGFNWNPVTRKKGALGFITGGSKLVIRAGYARTYDTQFLINNINTFGSFPFTAAQNFLSPPTSFSYRTFVNSTVSDISTPWELSRIGVSKDYRAPATDQISFDIQRELAADLVVRVGYVRTRGTGLFQSIDGNPRLQCPFGTGPGTCNTTGIDINTGAPLTEPVPLPDRVDRNRGAITIRSNAGSSTYDALQTSLEKRLSHGLSFGLHYTWSAFVDTNSDVLPVSPSEPAFAQDGYNRNSDWARSAYDRPHRLSGNIIYELPFFQKQHGYVGKLLGGWQINSFFNFQSGAPMSPLNGSDPAGTGNTVRPNVFTNLDVSRMTIAQLYLINRQLVIQAEDRARQIFNSLSQETCVAGWFPGPPLPFTLFSAPRGRITCDAQGNRGYVVEYNGILEGQRVGNAGRNILRADGFRNVDIGIIKNTRVAENIRAQISVDLFNAFNSRNFGIPSGVITSPDFLNHWATDGGNRRIILGARLVF